MSEQQNLQRISIMTMSEAERQYYLGKSGIHLWYARSPLPGAAPSPEFRFPAEDSVPEPASDPIVSRPPQSPRARPAKDATGKHRIAGIQALMADREAEAPKPPPALKASEAQASVAEEPSAAEVPELEAVTEADQQIRIDARLGFWVSERSVLVSGVSDEASARLQDALAENILASLGESLVPEGAHEIRWPVFGNPRVPGNGLDDFHGVLRSASKEFGSRRLLLLGVLTDEQLPDRSEWLVSALGIPAVDFPRSLAELAAVPAYKRDLWQQLKSAIGV